MLAYDPETGEYQDRQASEEPVQGGQGYIVYMTEAVEPLIFEGSPECGRVVLREGMNLVGFPCAEEGDDVAGLVVALEEAGGAGVVGSVSRFDAAAGVFQPAVPVEGQVYGPTFAIMAGEGYLIFLKADVELIGLFADGRGYAGTFAEAETGERAEVVRSDPTGGDGDDRGFAFGCGAMPTQEDAAITRQALAVVLFCALPLAWLVIVSRRQRIVRGG